LDSTLYVADPSFASSDLIFAFSGGSLGTDETNPAADFLFGEGSADFDSAGLDTSAEANPTPARKITDVIVSKLRYLEECISSIR
jgi:hypothetical protein